MRTMTFRALIFLVAAIVLAVLTGTVVYSVAQQAGSKAAAAPPSAVPTVDVVVAAADMPVRTVITAEMLTVKSYPTQLAPTDALSGTSEIVGRTTAVPVYKGQPVVRGQLATADRRAISAAIERGKVLVAFPSADPLTNAGLINVGDHVDILASVTQGSGENSKVSQTTLQNLEVLDVLLPGKEGGKATSLVFAVDHQVAVVMKYLRDSAAVIDVVIRSRAEDELARTTSVDLQYIVGTYAFRSGGPR